MTTATTTQVVQTNVILGMVDASLRVCFLFLFVEVVTLLVHLGSRSCSKLVCHVV
jgi:hypothetical protein